MRPLIYPTHKVKVTTMNNIPNNVSFLQREKNQNVAMFLGDDITTLNNDGEPVTTSLVIADGVGNSHATVIKLIRQNIDDLQEFGPLRFQIQVTRSDGRGGQQAEVAILNEQQATLLISFMRNIGVVKEFKKQLVKAFFAMRSELNNRSHIDPLEALRDPATMRSLLLGFSEKVMVLEDQLKTSQPKADALDRIATADGSFCISDAAKQLQVRPKDLFAHLQLNKWIYRRQGTSWLGYQERIQQGLLEHKVTEIDKGDGTTRITTQVRLTAKGLTKLSETFTQQLM